MRLPPTVWISHLFGLKLLSVGTYEWHHFHRHLCRNDMFFWQLFLIHRALVLSRVLFSVRWRNELFARLKLKNKLYINKFLLLRARFEPQTSRSTSGRFIHSTMVDPFLSFFLFLSFSSSFLMLDHVFYTH